MGTVINISDFKAQKSGQFESTAVIPEPQQPSFDREHYRRSEQVKGPLDDDQNDLAAYSQANPRSFPVELFEGSPADPRRQLAATHIAEVLEDHRS